MDTFEGLWGFVTRTKEKLRSWPLLKIMMEQNGQRSGQGQGHSSPEPLRFAAEEFYD